MTKDKTPWGEGTPWESSTQFFTYLRGCLRLSWKRHPTKLKVIKERREQIPNPNPRGNKSTVFGFKCEMCHNQFALKDCQVDHITPAGSLKKKEDIQGFIERLLWVTEDDLRLVCKPCNNALAMAEKQNITFEEATLQKKAIEILKDSKKCLTWFKERSILYPSNAKLRREAIIKYLEENKDEII